MIEKVQDTHKRAIDLCSAQLSVKEPESLGEKIKKTFFSIFHFLSGKNQELKEDATYTTYDLHTLSSQDKKAKAVYHQFFDSIEELAKERNMEGVFARIPTHKKDPYSLTRAFRCLGALCSLEEKIASVKGNKKVNSTLFREGEQNQEGELETWKKKVLLALFVSKDKEYEDLSKYRTLLLSVFEMSPGSRKQDPMLVQFFGGEVAQKDLDDFFHELKKGQPDRQVLGKLQEKLHKMISIENRLQVLGRDRGFNEELLGKTLSKDLASPEGVKKMTKFLYDSDLQDKTSVLHYLLSDKGIEIRKQMAGEARNKKNVESALDALTELLKKDPLDFFSIRKEINIINTELHLSKEGTKESKDPIERLNNSLSPLETDTKDARAKEFWDF